MPPRTRASVRAGLVLLERRCRWNKTESMLALASSVSIWADRKEYDSGSREGQGRATWSDVLHQLGGIPPEFDPHTHLKAVTWTYASNPREEVWARLRKHAVPKAAVPMRNVRRSMSAVGYF